ncbi:MAG: hypothetical protein WCO79_02360 [bacterium]
MVDVSKFEAIKKKGEAFYQNIGQVYCPYLKEKVSFNAQGLEHLKFKQRGKARNLGDQYMRFKLIAFAPKILGASGTLQGLLRTNAFERVKIHSRTEMFLRSVSYFEFIAIVDQFRVKILVKQIEDGEKFFWSIIPFWSTNSSTRERTFHDKDFLENL